MAQVCAAEGCTQERTVVWQPALNSGPDGRCRMFCPPGHEEPVFAAVPLCLSHANAVANGTPIQFKHRSRRYTFDGQEVTECQ